MNTRLLAISKVLKLLAKILGAFLISYGFFVGLIGIGPDGEVSFQFRIIGLAILALGFLYYIPNETIEKSNLMRCFYLSLTILPGVILVISSMYTISISGFDSFFISGGLSIAIVMLPLSFIAPASLLLFIASTK